MIIKLLLILIVIFFHGLHICKETYFSAINIMSVEYLFDFFPCYHCSNVNISFGNLFFLCICSLQPTRNIEVLSEMSEKEYWYVIMPLSGICYFVIDFLCMSYSY